ncbi:unnamed protein product [Paramecium sonneborni]|uniref:Uncharacterized protein n=1 Tax=Paramecium sonneborni TaxID=65129 RepID=A0A8S1M2Y2_9CILI|nr:unnamed protein product [Paramecium sonneborni]
MLQRKILVPLRRKQQSETQPEDDFYFENNFETVEVEEITSMLAKRLKFENQDEGANESLKLKKCCYSDDKFINCKPGLEILTQQQQISFIPNDKNCMKQVNQHKIGEKRTIQIKNITEFKHMRTGEINYLEFIEFSDVQKTLKCKKKKGTSEITKKIHKF